MPVAPTYPGVYIEEIPSGVRTITGVATSITAFIGRALRGPVDEAVTINSYADFERIFGGLWIESRLGFAVRDFYLNSGSQAIIVRLFHPLFATETERAAAEAAAKEVAEAAKAANDGAAAKAAAEAKKNEIVNNAQKSNAERQAARVVAEAIGTLANHAAKPEVARIADAAVIKASHTKARLSVGGVELEAAYEGRWGAYLRASVDLDVSQEVAQQLGLTTPDLFNLTVTEDAPGGTTERFLNLSVKDSARRIDRVLAAESRLVRWAGTLNPNAAPTVTEKSDNVTTAETALATARKTLEDSKRSQASEQAITTAETAVKTATDAVNTAKKAMADTCSDGSTLSIADFDPANGQAAKKGLYALEHADLFNLLCIPPYLVSDDIDPDLIDKAAAYCDKRRAMLLIDPPAAWNEKERAKSGIATQVGSPSLDIS